MFKVGDKVRRKDTSQYDGSWNHTCASLGKLVDGGYVVSSVSPAGDYITLKGFPRQWLTMHFEVVEAAPTHQPDGQDMVKSPKHYEFFPGIEAIQIIARSMTEDQFKGYCMGNALKYRLRAGKKFNTEEDLKKADQYITLFDKYRHCCLDEDI